MTQNRYRCVCGESFEFDGASETICPHCGRRYDPRVVESPFAETLLDDTSFAGSSTPAVASALIGIKLQHFSIVAHLGDGGMGSVYEALDESLQRYVALKVIRDGNRRLDDRLIQEARAQARVNHPHVVHIYYVGHTGEYPFFAMELVKGRTLSQRLQQGPLRFGEVVRVALQAVSALEQAIRFDVVHGDIKPGNILEADPQTIKISDFGLARRLAEGDAGSSLSGTPEYMAPERVRGRPSDIHSDIYSLGVTLIELTFGWLPFQLNGSTLLERLESRLTQTPRFPDKSPHDVPPAWNETLRRMLATEPMDRYDNYRDLAADLTKLRPRNLTFAARSSRLISWLIDVILLTVWQGVVWGAAEFLTYQNRVRLGTDAHWIAAFAQTGLLTVLALGVLWMQCRWSATLGKKMLQLVIVDAHGLPATRRTLAVRALLQLPTLTMLVEPLLNLVGLEPVGNAIPALCGLWTLCDGLTLLVRKDNRALHDVLLRTNVVLQTAAP
jgi:uncharacterized RDD family membrane protein YckC